MCVCFLCLRGFDLCCVVCVDRLLDCRLTSRFTSVSSAKIWYKIILLKNWLSLPTKTIHKYSVFLLIKNAAEEQIIYKAKPYVLGKYFHCILVFSWSSHWLEGYFEWGNFDIYGEVFESLTHGTVCVSIYNKGRGLIQSVGVLTALPPGFRIFWIVPKWSRVVSRHKLDPAEFSMAYRKQN